MWGLTFCFVGYLAGESYHVVEKQVGTVGALVTATVLLGGLLLWHRHRRHEARAASTDADVAAEDVTSPPEAA